MAAKNPADVFTPALIHEQLHHRLGSSGSRLFLLRGTYHPSHRGEGARYGYFFDMLSDELGQAQVTLQVPDALRSSLKPEHVYTVKAFFSPRVVEARGVIEVRVRVCEILEEEAPRMTPQELERARLLANVDRRAREVERTWRAELEQNEVLSLAIVTSAAGIAQEDLKRQLGPFAKYVHLEQCSVNLSQTSEILSAVERTQKRVVALVRGGGAGLEIFDDPELATALTSLKGNKLLVSALGHAEDAPLAQQVADLAFDTPTDLGQHLRALVEDTLSRFSTARELEKERERRAQLETDKKRLEDNREQLLQEREAARQSSSVLEQDRVRLMQEREADSTELARLKYRLAVSWVIGVLLALAGIVLAAVLWLL